MMMFDTKWSKRPKFTLVGTSYAYMRDRSIHAYVIYNIEHRIWVQNGHWMVNNHSKQYPVPDLKIEWRDRIAVQTVVWLMTALLLVNDEDVTPTTKKETVGIKITHYKFTLFPPLSPVCEVLFSLVQQLDSTSLTVKLTKVCDVEWESRP